jgi:hypothetical protein
MTENKRLSVSVTVRRMSWAMVSPICHWLKYLPAITLTLVQNRHPELVSGSIVPHKPPVEADE